MFNHTFCAQDWPGPEPTASQDSAAHLRARFARLEDELEQLKPTLPRLAEPGVEDLRDLHFLIQALLKLLDDTRCYWDAQYLQELDEA
jgi:hypothetical protein